jgi:hypothetical protein
MGRREAGKRSQRAEGSTRPPAPSPNEDSPARQMAGPERAEPHAFGKRHGAPCETALAAAVVIRWGRRLVSGTAVVAPGATSGVCPREGHTDTEEDAGKETRDQLPHAELAHALTFLSASRARPLGPLRRKHEMASATLLPCRRKCSHRRTHGAQRISTRRGKALEVPEGSAPPPGRLTEAPRGGLSNQCSTLAPS